MNDIGSASLPDSSGEQKENISTIVVPKITALCPKFLDAIHSLINEAKARKMNVGLYAGLRTPEEQDALYAKGRTIPGDIVTKAKAWESWHCYGIAADIVFKNGKGEWTWADSCDWDGLGQVGEIFGLSWGGKWTAFPDKPHFQMTGKIPNVREAKRILFENGIDKLWSLI